MRGKFSQASGSSGFTLFAWVSNQIKHAKMLQADEENVNSLTFGFKSLINFVIGLALNGFFFLGSYLLDINGGSPMIVLIMLVLIIPFFFPLFFWFRSLIFGICQTMQNKKILGILGIILSTLILVAYGFCFYYSMLVD